MKYIYSFAVDYDYNCGAYSAGAYQTNACESTSASGPLDGLANTGYDVLIPVFIGIALIVAGVILFTKRWLRKRRQNQSFSVQSKS